MELEKMEEVRKERDGLKKKQVKRKENLNRLPDSQKSISVRQNRINKQNTRKTV